MIIIAAFGILFGTLSIFTVGVIFVPLAALCAIVALIGSIAQGRFTPAFLAILAFILAGLGVLFSPTLWPLVAAIAVR